MQTVTSQYGQRGAFLAGGRERLGDPVPATPGWLEVFLAQLPARVVAWLGSPLVSCCVLTTLAVLVLPFRPLPPPRAAWLSTYERGLGALEEPPAEVEFGRVGIPPTEGAVRQVRTCDVVHGQEKQPEPSPGVVWLGKSAPEAELGRELADLRDPVPWRIQLRRAPVWVGERDRTSAVGIGLALPRTCISYKLQI